MLAANQAHEGMHHWIDTHPDPHIFECDKHYPEFKGEMIPQFSEAGAMLVGAAVYSEFKLKLSRDYYLNDPEGAGVDYLEQTISMFNNYYYGSIGIALQAIYWIVHEGEGYP